MAKTKKEKIKKPVTTGKAILFAVLLGVGVFVESLFFVPLGRVAGWNSILLVALSLGTLLCFYQTLRVQTPGKRVVWGAFTGLLTWALLGQLIPYDRAPHTSAFARPFSELHLYSFEAIPLLIFFALALAIAYKTKAINGALGMIGMVFTSTWAVEMYFRSYSEAFPEEALSGYANLLAALFIAILVGSLVGIVRSKAPEKKLFFGYWLYYGIIYTWGALFVFPNPMPEFW
jgi:hypothetical protein